MKRGLKRFLFSFYFSWLEFLRIIKGLENIYHRKFGCNYIDKISRIIFSKGTYLLIDERLNVSNEIIFLNFSQKEKLLCSKNWSRIFILWYKFTLNEYFHFQFIIFFIEYFFKFYEVFLCFSTSIVENLTYYRVWNISRILSSFISNVAHNFTSLFVIDLPSSSSEARPLERYKSLSAKQVTSTTSCIRSPFQRLDISIPVE